MLIVVVYFLGLTAPQKSLFGYQFCTKVEFPIKLPHVDNEIVNILISQPPIFNERFQNFIFLKSFEIEFATRDQNMNGLWHEERRYRFKASKFQKISARKQFTPEFYNSLFKEIGHLPQIRHGRKYEGEAILRYLKHPNISYYKCGFIIHPYAPHLGASPDGIVFQSECGYGVLEVKCPYSKKFNTAVEGCGVKNFCLRLNENNQPMLKDTSEYYYQIHSQMLLAGLRWEDFVMYFRESNELFEERILIDLDFCTKMYNNLTEKYKLV